MTSDELSRLEREQRSADEHYNDALTELDRVVVSAAGRDLTRDDFARVGTALLKFLQQITAFVDTKDRRIAAAVEAQVHDMARALDPVEELRTHVRVLQRAIESAGARASPAERQPAAVQPVGASEARRTPAPGGDHRYVGFEDQFRGSDTAIEERLRAYLGLFEGRRDILDVGCGRGEFLAALKGAGVAARGIDANVSMVAVGRERGLDVTCADAVAYLRDLPPESLGGLIATQVVEHLEPAYLMAFIDAAASALRPGAPIVLETVNPACWLAFFSSYIRDITHVRPIHPDTLQYLLRASGFERVTRQYSAPVPDHMKMKTVDLPADVLAAQDSLSVAVARVAHALNTNAVVLNNLMFTHLDYAVIGYRS
jgi:SAM-dependent methyltransferase